MLQSPIAKIISYNSDNVQLCASAARISTTKGDSLEIFHQDKALEDNIKLVGRVLDSGHKSLIEHAVFSIAFCNVSAFVEQFLIEFRLASFTIKSRRYVDFGDMGYYVPPELKGDCLKIYRDHMDFLFSEYRYFLEQGVPKEDARFILPYSFFSNFYCTINARELTHILNDMLYGRGRGFSEIKCLADQLISQIEALFPCLINEIHDNADEAIEGKAFLLSADKPDTERKIGKVSLLSRTNDGAKNLIIGYLAKHNMPLNNWDDIIANEDILEALVKQIIHSERPRELEQLQYTFLISGITLSGITHIARHRIQSIIIPPLSAVDISRYIIPESIQTSGELTGRYLAVFERARDCLKILRNEGAASNQWVYLALSGNLLDIVTTMNARQLLHYLQLRTCNRAQWEIRNISNHMLKLLREKSPYIFNKIGPSCFVKGCCPEGKLTCNKAEEVQRLYTV